MGSAPDQDRVKIGPRVPRKLWSKIKAAAVALGRRSESILEEALNDWLVKHRAELEEAGITV